MSDHVDGSPSLEKILLPLEHPNVQYYVLRQKTGKEPTQKDLH